MHTRRYTERDDGDREEDEKQPGKMQAKERKNKNKV